MTFLPDERQSRVLAHRRGALLVTGAAGTGKTAVLRERFARLLEAGADPERVGLVVGSRAARSSARSALLRRLTASLPDLRVMTVHGLAYQVVTARHRDLGYDAPPEVLSAADHFARVQELLAGEDPALWPAYGSMLRMRGFADQVRQFLLRAQEARLRPEDLERSARARGLPAWLELAGFYRRYLQVMDSAGAVDFAGLVEQAAAAVQKGPPLYDHLVVDEFEDTTLAAEALLLGMDATTLVVAGNPDAHVFSFQGTTDVPLRRFRERIPTAEHVELVTRHRGDTVAREAWVARHTSEEHGAIARELRRIHVEERVPWRRLAVVVRRQGTQVAGLLRALDDAGVPRWMPERGLATWAEPATHPYLLALRWVARPAGRAALVEPVLTSDLARIPPAAARGLLRLAGPEPETAFERVEGLSPAERESIESLRSALAAAERVASRSVTEAFRALWTNLPCAARLVAEAEASTRARRDLDAVVAFADLVARAGESGDPSVEAFLASLEAGDEGPGRQAPAGPEPDAVLVLTAHATVGREVDTVIVAGATEGNFPSLSRPEPMFDLAVLERAVSQSERNAMRLADERRLFRVVDGRAARRVVFTASDDRDETGTVARSRFVEELGVAWTAAPDPGAAGVTPLSAAEAVAGWRRVAADVTRPAAERLAAIDGMIAVGADPARWWFRRDWTDTGAPLHETIRTSYSRLDRLENCELQFVLSEELGLGRPSGYHAWVGSLVHRLIEDYENGALPDRTVEGLLAEVDRRWKPDEFPSHAVSEAFRRLVRQTMLPNWYAEYGGRPALGTERRFEFGFDGATVTGYIDRVGEITAGGNRITDYKTGKADNAGKAEDNLQLGIYYLAVSESEALADLRPVRAVELAFLRGKWRDTTRVHRLQWMPNSESAEEYQARMRERLAGLIGRLRHLLEVETYRPSTQANCHFCEFKSLCPLWPEGAPLFGVEASRPAADEPASRVDPVEVPT